MEQNYDLNSYSRPCPKFGCRKKACECGLDYVFIPAALGNDALGDIDSPKEGAYCNTIVEYGQSGHVYIYSKDGIPVEVQGDDLSGLVTEEARIRKEADDALRADLNLEIKARGDADAVLEQEIEDLRNAPDVVDIVASYADLLEYDTSKLGDNDIVRVLVDEEHDDASSYYRWDKHNEQWIYIGSVEGYYTKDQTDQLLSGKQNTLTAGTYINIAANDTISVSIPDVAGATASTDGTKGLVPAPDAGDQGKALKGDGTWDDVKTVFYANSSESGATKHIYKDVSFTTAASAQNVMDASAKGEVVLRSFNIATPTQYNEVALNNVWSDPSNNDFQFVFTGDGHSYTFMADTLADTVFGYSSAKYFFGGSLVQTSGQSTTDVMSQKATTDYVDNKYSTEAFVFTLVDGTTVTKNIAIGAGV